MFKTLVTLILTNERLDSQGTSRSGSSSSRTSNLESVESTNLNDLGGAFEESNHFFTRNDTNIEGVWLK